MRAAPALQLTFERFDLWRGTVALLAAASSGAIAAWLGAGAWSAVAAVLAALASLPLSRRAPRRLVWDGERWRLGSPAAGADAMPAGDVIATIDLGSFMLLRFSVDDSRAVEWLPAQRRGVEGSWHALRCAVYSPRPSAASAPPDDPFPPA